MTRIQISRQIREQILSALRAAYPEEGCGALIGREAEETVLAITAAEALPNAEPVRGEDRFIIEPHAYAELEQRLAGQGDGSRIVGFFHSHPDGIARPSSVDLEAAAGLYEVTRTYYVYAIAALATNSAEMTFWMLNAAADDFVEVRA